MNYTFKGFISETISKYNQITLQHLWNGIVCLSLKVVFKTRLQFNGRSLPTDTERVESLAF